MSKKSSISKVQTNLILVTGAAGGIGSIGAKIIEMLTKRGLCVRALVRQTDDRANALEKLGAQVVIGDLTNLADLNKALTDVKTVFFTMSISESYLEAALSTITAAKFHKVTTFVNLSLMSVSHMDVTHATEGTQQKQHWLVEQALKWSQIPAINLRPSILLEHPFFTKFARDSILDSEKIKLPFEDTFICPIAAHDVARVATEILVAPRNHIGRVYEMTGPESLQMSEIAAQFSKELKRKIEYENVPIEEWMQKPLRDANLRPQLENHVASMARMIQREKYSRLICERVQEITGTPPLSVGDWIKENRNLFVPEESQI